MARLTKPPFFLVNAFASSQHGGNQAAVVVFTAMDKRVDNVEYMSNIARDFDLPMTAFVVPRNENGTQFAIRWFTARGVESELCGHATLASAFVLFHRYSPDATVIHFETQTKGTLSAARVPSPTGFGVALSLPLGPTTASLGSSNDIADIVAKATGIDVSDILEVGTYGEGSHSSAVVEVKSSVPLKDLKVDTSILVPTLAYQTVVTQSAGGDKINSRVFIPGVGIPEDPVTGSAHAVLTEYYFKGPGRARIGDATTLDAYQVSARGGHLTCEIVDGKAKIVGRAWLTASGVLEL